MKTFKELCAAFYAVQVLDSYGIEKKYREEKGEDAEMAYKEKIAAYAENDKNKMERTIIRHNAECVFLTEILPAVLDVYNKYAWKRVGEKTRDKIRAAVKEVLGDNEKYISVYIDSDGINYSILNSAWKRAYFCYNQETKKSYSMWDADGKMNKLESFMFHLYKGEYIEDSKKYIAMKREQAEKIKELSIEIEKAKKEFDDNLCDGFDTLDYGKTNTYFCLRM